MKNGIKLFLIFPILVLTYIFSSIHIISNSTTPIDEFENFSQSLIKLISDEDPAENKDISIDLENLTLQNNTYMISSEMFTRLTGNKIKNLSENQIEISSNTDSITLTNGKNLIRNNTTIDVMSEPTVISENETLFPIENIAENLGYKVNFKEDSIILSRPFSTKRLIIKSSSRLDKLNATGYAEGYNDLHVFEYSSEADTKFAYEYYTSLDCVEYVDIDTVFYAEEVDNIETSGLEDSFSYTTWGATTIGADDYSNYLLNTNKSLDDVIVAVLDTGLDSDHEWFTGRVATGGKNYSSSASSTNFEYEDVHGHGTHVAGTIVDLTLDNVKILPIKVLSNKGFGYLTSIINGINYVSNLKSSSFNVCAINMSLGGLNSPIDGYEHKSYTEAIENAYTKGILSVVAAGNENQDCSTSSPANITRAITVASVSQEGNHLYSSSFSNHGEFVDISAPGENIVSACVNGGTTAKSGTSMATPHVAGAVALIYSNPNKTYTLSEVETILKTSAIDLGSPGWDALYGEGVVNISYAYGNIIQPVTFSNTNSECTNSFTLSLTSTTTNAQIYYTLDGSSPSYENGLLYTSDIRINKSVKIRAIALLISNNKVTGYSDETSMSYIFNGKDISSAYKISNSGELVSYRGILTDITVPSTYNGITIKTIGKRAFITSAAETITLPSTITTIGNYAFDSCKTLKEIFAPNVTKVNMYSFRSCANLQYLTDTHFPHLTTIERFAFQECNQITTINLSNVTSVGYSSFDMGEAGNSQLTSITLPKVKSIAFLAFYNCYALTSINLPCVEAIGSEAFECCNLKTISLPKLKSIGTAAFADDTNLTAINLPELLYIGAEVFSDNINLTTVSVPKAEFIGIRAFSSCLDLESVELPNILEIQEYAFYNTGIKSLNAPKLKYIYNHAFYNASLTNIILPNVVEIYENAFSNNTNLTSVTLSSCIESISDSSFVNIPSTCKFSIYSDTVAEDFVKNNSFTYSDLSNHNEFDYLVVNNEIHITGYNGELVGGIVIPSTINSLPVTQINSEAFKNNLNIYSINLPNLKRIEDSAFSGCTNLERIVVGNIKFIGENAFSGCTNLSEIDIYNVEVIEDLAFYNCPSLLKIKLSDNIAYIGNMAIGYDSSNNIQSNFHLYGYSNTIAEQYAMDTSINFGAAYQQMSTIYYSTYTNNGTTEAYIALVDDNISGKIIVPSTINGYTVSKIGDESFINCAFIEGVLLPDTVNNIGHQAFDGCLMLKEINLDNITVIGVEAFKNCPNIKNVYLPNISIIYDAAFSKCVEKIVLGTKFSAYSGTPIDLNTPIYGYSYSTAQSYCQDSGHTFIAIDKLAITSNLSSSITVNKNDNLTLAITNKGFDEKYQWYTTTSTVYNGVAIPGATESNYSIDTSIVDSGTKYFVQITDWDGSTITSNICNVIIQGVATKYKINATAGANGTISPSGEIEVSEGTSQTFYFTPNTGYYVSKIIVDNTELSRTQLSNAIANGYTFEKINSDHSISVYFEIYKFIITVTQADNGTISSANQSYNYGSNATFSIVADTGYHIEYLLIDTQVYTSTLSSYTFNNITQNHTISAYFAPNTNTKYIVNYYQESLTSSGTKFGSKYYDLYENLTCYGTTNTQTNAHPKTYTGFTRQQFEQANIKADGSTKINILYNRNMYSVAINLTTGISSVSGTGTYPFGTLITLSAELSPGYEFVSWKSNNTNIIASSTSNPYLFNLPAKSITLTPVVKVQQFNVDIEIDTTQGTYTRTINNPIDYNQSVKIEISPAIGYEIKEITINGIIDSEATKTGICNLNNITSDIVVKVTFKLKQYTITTNSPEHGSISPSGEIKVNHGTSKTFIFTPDTGYYLTKLVIDNTNIPDIELAGIIKLGYTFTDVVSNHKIQATFGIRTYHVFTNINGHGDVSINKDTIYLGDSATITITPHIGYQISTILIDGEKVNNTNQLTFENISDDHIVEITFTKISYQISISTDGNGTILSSDNSNLVYYGESKTLNIVPNIGYKIKDVKVNNESIGIVTSYTFNNVTANQSISAEFEKIMLNIVLDIGENGSVSPNYNMNVEYGSKQTFTITPNENYDISNIEINGVKTTITDNVLVLTNIVENISLKIRFAKIHKITSLVSLYGTITPSKEVLEGSTQTFNFTPNTGYKIKEVLIDNESVGYMESFTFINIENSHTIQVIYELKTYKITISKTGEGSASSELDLLSVKHGESRTITLSPDKDWSATKAFINGSQIKIINNTIILDYVSEDINLEIVFEEDSGFILTPTTLLILAGLTAIGIAIIVIRKKQSKNN